MMWLYTVAEIGRLLSKWFWSGIGTVTRTIIQEIFYICGFFQRAAEKPLVNRWHTEALKVFFHSLYVPFIHSSHTTLTLAETKKGLVWPTLIQQWYMMQQFLLLLPLPLEWLANQLSEMHCWEERKGGRTVSSSHTSLSNQSQIVWHLAAHFDTSCKDTTWRAVYSRLHWLPLNCVKSIENCFHEL